MIDCHLRPSFGALRIQDLGILEVDAYISKRSHLNPKTVNNQLTLLGSMLNKARELKWLLNVPPIKKLKTPGTEDFRYLKTKDEIRKFLASAQVEGKAVYALYATAVFTGLRAGELAGLEKSDIDFSKRMISVRRSYEGPTKSGKLRYVPILDPLLPLLKEWALQIPAGPLFPNESGRLHQKSARVFQEVFHRVLDHAEFPKTEHRGSTRRCIVFHSLRHTFASHWIMDGGDLFKLQTILGHHSPTMTQKYAHLAPQAFSNDYQRFAGCLPTSMSDVIRFPSPQESSCSLSTN